MSKTTPPADDTTDVIGGKSALSRQDAIRHLSIAINYLTETAVVDEAHRNHIDRMAQGQIELARGFLAKPESKP